jgi:uncharacterized protein RhaS with RHS repeats
VVRPDSATDALITRATTLNPLYFQPENKPQEWQGKVSVQTDAYATGYQYDANGNILNLTRKDEAGADLDAMTYTYPRLNGKLTSNRLQSVNDPLKTNNPEDIEGLHTYQYDPIGNLIRDEAEKTTIHWNVYGKVSQVIPDDPTAKPALSYQYDASGNRIAKTVTTTKADKTQETALPITFGMPKAT